MIVEFCKLKEKLHNTIKLFMKFISSCSHYETCGHFLLGTLLILVINVWWKLEKLTYVVVYQSYIVSLPMDKRKQCKLSVDKGFGGRGGVVGEDLGVCA